LELRTVPLLIWSSGDGVYGIAPGWKVAVRLRNTGRATDAIASLRSATYVRDFRVRRAFTAPGGAGINDLEDLLLP
jgi:hypothetical protein